MIVCLLISALVFVLVYFTLNNYIVATIFFLVSFIYGLFTYKNFKTYFDFIKRRKECNNFINTFSISLSISNSLDKAYQDTSIQTSKSLSKELSKLISIDTYENLKSLEEYFNCSNYQIFLNNHNNLS